MEADTENTIMETPKSASADVPIVETPSKELTPAASRNTSVPAYDSEPRDKEMTDAISPRAATTTTQARFNLHLDNEDNEPRYAHVEPKVEPEAVMEKPLDPPPMEDAQRNKKDEAAPNGTLMGPTKEPTEPTMPTTHVDNDAAAAPTTSAKATTPAVNDGEATPDDAESILLSPPPESLSPDQEVLNEGPEDEIVVGSVKGKSTGSNTPAATAAAATATATTTTSITTTGKGDSGEAMDVDHEDLAAEGGGAQEPEQRPKRKRASLYDDLAEEKLDRSILDDSIDEPSAAGATPSRAADSNVNNNVTNTKGVILGHWRDSDAADGDKHVVKGFIDSRDRLRTRVQPVNRDGKSVANKYPLKPGPGASWVTFQNIVFDDHLVHLDQQQVKEYVKIRADMPPEETEEDTKDKDKRAVQQAIQICQSRGPLPEGGQQPLIAYGAAVPEHARMAGWKRRRTGHSGVSPTTPDAHVLPSNNQQPVLPTRIAPTYQPVQPAPSTRPVPDDLPGHRPTKILLGYWKESAEAHLKDKHAVFGILGNNDMFRVKVGRETRDGRPMQSNFPQGAGALWINSHQWEREDYLADLTREEIKEYCRVRQWQIDHGERPDDVIENRKQAITEARRRCAAGISKPSKPNGVSAASSQSHNHAHSPGQNHNHFTDAAAAAAAGASSASGHQHEAPAHETRRAIARRSGGPTIYPNPPGARPGSSPQTPAFRAANRSSSSSHTVDPRVERASSLALNAVSRIEATQAKVEERDAHRGPPSGGAPHGGPGGPGGGPPGHGGDAFRESIGRLNNVWSAQEAHRIRTGNEDAKIHMGVKYERKRNGPFAGKLVSQGAIISIDGEDYVEYRVLTKPTFI